MARFLIGLTLFLFAARAHAQTDPHPRCVLEPTPECRRVHDREEARDYGIAPVTRLAEAGYQARRLLIFNAGYDNVGALTFSRRGGETPRVEFLLPGSFGRRPPPLFAELPLAVWAEILAESRAFDEGRRFADLDPQSICLDAWVYRLESADPVAAGTAAAPRRRIVDQCAGPYHPLWLAERALALLPGCSAVASESFGTAYHQLVACARLAGDRPVAGEAAAVILALMGATNFNDESVTVDRLFSADAMLEWQGRHVTGPPAIASAWAQVLARRQDPYLHWNRAEGLGADRAVVDAELVADRHTSTDDLEEDYLVRAPVRFTLVRGADGRLRIAAVRIGAFQRPRR